MSDFIHFRKNPIKEIFNPNEFNELNDDHKFESSNWKMNPSKCDQTKKIFFIFEKQINSTKFPSQK